MKEYPVNKVVTPAPSSWGYGGFSETWLNGSNDWIYRHLHRASKFFKKFTEKQEDMKGHMKRAFDQAVRELLLARASDWAFMINTGNMIRYGRNRTRRHIANVYRLCRQLDRGKIDKSWLSILEKQNNIFPEINFYQFKEEKDINKKISGTLSADEVKKRGGGKRKKARGGTKKIHVAMVSPEITPFAKTGGLADVIGSLSLALEGLGFKVSMIMPAYRQVLSGRFPLIDTGKTFSVPVSYQIEKGTILKTKVGKDITVYFIRADRYFDREYLYTTPDGDYSDNARRFIFFSRAALETIKDDPPHILHAHDWQTALSIVFLKTQPFLYPAMEKTKTVFTIHNLGYQGLFWALDWHLLNLDKRLFTPSYLEFYGKINFLKGGIVFADVITTVSPAYAEEIKTKEHGCGLEGVFIERSADLAGILNGIDYNVWNPETDPYIIANYSVKDLSGKKECKRDLQRTFNLPERDEVPLIGMVARLTLQKGIDLFEEAVDILMQRNIQFVILGTGESKYHDFLRKLSRQYPEKVGVELSFNEAIAHKIEAGADMFLMPSKYEPGGLNQLYSFRYGTIPVVRATGGLKDTVRKFNEETGEGNGFLFDAYEAQALIKAVDCAISVFNHKDKWNRLIKNAMKEDFSWERSAKSYVNLYRRLLEEF